MDNMSSLLPPSGNSFGDFIDDVDCGYKEKI